jgi:KDO2-lipid IV(A) lauroyltransferase
VNVNSVFWRRLAYAGARYGPVAWVRFSPALFGLAFAAALPDARRAVRRNLRHLCGRRSKVEEQVDLCRTFVAYAHCLAESLALERPEAIEAKVALVGKERLEQALGAGRGIVLVTAHSGAWDAAASLLARDYRADVLVVMAPEQDGSARRLHDAVRFRGGARIMHRGGHPLDALPLLSHLRRGGIIAVQLDRPMEPAASLEVKLFERAWRIPRGPFLLASSSGAPVLPVFARRLGYFDYEVTVAPAIQVHRRPDEDELRRVARRAAWVMERFLRAHPTQWFHFDGNSAFEPVEERAVSV